MQLMLTGKGILGKDDALMKRTELNLDYWDYSCDPIRIMLSSEVENLSSEFVVVFLRKTAYRCFDRSIPMSFNNPRDLKDEETGLFPLSVGPYVFKLDNNEILAHRLRGAMMSWPLQWQIDRKKLEGPSPF